MLLIDVFSFSFWALNFSNLESEPFLGDTNLLFAMFKSCADIKAVGRGFQIQKAGDKDSFKFNFYNF
jgi:hypothetical protein